MELTRRKFLQGSAGMAAAFGISLFDNPLLRKAFADAIQETPIIWLAAGACSGCSVSLLNALSPRIQDVLLDQVIPGHHTEMAFHPTIMAASGIWPCRRCMMLKSSCSCWLSKGRSRQG